MTEPHDDPNKDRLACHHLEETFTDEELADVEEIDRAMRYQSAPVLQMADDGRSATLPDGATFIPVRMIERENTLNLMSPERFLAYGLENPGWLSYWDAQGHVRWKRVPSDPLPAA
jgi:hypothetical protein